VNEVANLEALARIQELGFHEVALRLDGSADDVERLILAPMDVRRGTISRG
jgi:hypothetical protein